jgi:surfactin synthase thioesterase subunit
LHFAPYPIQVVLGEKDGVLIYDDTIDQIEGTKVELTTFPDGHMSHIENEAELKKVMSDFLKRV